MLLNKKRFTNLIDIERKGLDLILSADLPYTTDLGLFNPENNQCPNQKTGS